TVYSLYTEYEGDHTEPYTTLIGCKVSNLDSIPEGMVAKKFDGGDYLKLSAKGDITNNLIVDKWSQIFKLDIERAFSADFEVYGEKAQNPSDAEVDFYIAVK
ncbi:MAG: effector binding domain-containing protein, partial [Bacteroidota bacterium]